MRFFYQHCKMAESRDITYDNYSPIPADQLLRQNVLNYLEREQSLEIDEQAHGTTHNTNVNKSRKRCADSILYSYIKKPSTGPQSKIIRLQIYDMDEFKNIEMTCNCKATVCAQHVVDYIFSDEVYKCAKDLLSKMHRKLL